MKLPNWVHTGLKKLGYSISFEGAQESNRNRSYIYPIVADAKDTHNSYSRKQLMGISRYLTCNVGLVRGLFADAARYSKIGMPQSQSTDREWAQAAESWFKEWAKIPEVTSRWTWDDLQDLWDISADRDGDVGMILTDNPFPQLQLVEGHRIDDDGKGDTMDGVKINRVGRPVSYRVLQGEDKEPENIPAASFIHYFDPDRLSQFRGLSALQAGLNHARDIGDINSFLKQVIKNEASIALLKKTATGEANINDWQTGDNTDVATNDAILERVYGGQIPRLGENEDIRSLATDRPSPNIEKYLEFLIRDICYGMGIPFEFAWNPAALSGPAQRFVMVKAQRRFECRQRRKMRIADRIYGWAIAKAAKRGDIPELPSDWYKVRWQPPAGLTIDVGREAAQDRADFQAGLIAPSDFFSKQGYDEDDVIASRVAWARKLMTAAGMPASEKIPLWMLYQSTPNGLPQDGAPAEEQPAKKGKPAK